jgi:hypothetical protein
MTPTTTKKTKHLDQPNTAKKKKALRGCWSTWDFDWKEPKKLRNTARAV